MRAPALGGDGLSAVDRSRKARQDAAHLFASAGSLGPASQEAKTETSIRRTEIGQVLERRRSPVLSHPIPLRELPPHADTRPSPAETSKIIRTLTRRDQLILQVLHDYRYLTTFQIQDLFFPGLRSTQIRLQVLKDLGVIYRWKVIEQPNVTRRPSLLLLSPRGAGVVAGLHGDEPRRYVAHAREVRDHCWHWLHDIEANQFFVDLAVAAKSRSDQGLLLWLGEDYMRRRRQSFAREHRCPSPCPDGVAHLLAPSGEIYLELEWDRATETLARVRNKIRSYVDYYKQFRESQRYHVLFVVPDLDREREMRSQIRFERRYLKEERCCTFWTTTAARMREHGPLDAIWLRLDKRTDDAEDDDETVLRLRTPLDRMAPISSSPLRSAADCIGKPRWWERRPGGGQAG